MSCDISQVLCKIHVITKLKNKHAIVVIIFIDVALDSIVLPITQIKSPDLNMLNAISKLLTHHDQSGAENYIVFNTNECSDSDFFRKININAQHSLQMKQFCAE